ncbi:MAG TPA: glycosyltransferase, partial [Gemmataceae bacterium]|nr:glycosyltransferase [Gemmataceae bacterium]
PPCQKVLRRFADGWTHFLFVGRLSPNKRQDDVIRLFACYNRTIDRRSRLVLVGTWRGMERYLAELRALVRALDLQDYVVFTGHLAAPELGAHYRRADLFVSMSEHEGFCVPILEAMHFGLPILAYNAAAVPDTLGQTGVLFTRKEFPLLAEMAHLLLTDHGLRERVVLGQADRLADFRPAIVAQRFRAYVDELIAA